MSSPAAPRCTAKPKKKRPKKSLTAAQKFKSRLNHAKFYEHDTRNPSRIISPNVKSGAVKLTANQGGTKKIKHYWQRMKLLKQQQALMQKLISGCYCRCACDSHSQASSHQATTCQFYKIPTKMNLR